MTFGNRYKDDIIFYSVYIALQVLAIVLRLFNIIKWHWSIILIPTWLFLGCWVAVGVIVIWFAYKFEDNLGVYHKDKY